ncbi:MAG: ATP-binding protein [Paludibacteraceae bacterium]|nr:ATP-binding protein [Paludibacteraceae bacterium]
MEQIKKQNIVNHLQAYCERYESQKRAANSLKGVSAATVSQMLSGKWELIADDMWRNVAAQIGYKDEKWEAVQTRDFRLLTRLLDEAKENTLVMGVTGDAGSGKTFTLKHYTASHRQTYLLCCNEYWNRKLFLSELLAAMGRDYTGYTVGEMMTEAVRALKMQESPLLILDEADKLSDQVLYFFITLYNNLEDECGIVLCATQHLEKRIKKGIKLNKKGYEEIWSRLGRKCIRLNGVSASDITAVCEANGITDSGEIDGIIAESDSDLRRVKRRVHAVSRKRQSKAA